MNRKVRVAIDSGPLKSGHKVRGIGVHTRQLIRSLKEVSGDGGKVDIFPIDFSNNVSSLSKFDVTHFTSFHPFFLSLPGKKPCKKVVVTVHDLIPLIYPNQYPPGIKGKLNFLLQKLRLGYVDAIITISETSKKDICRFLKIDPDRVHVVHLAPGRKFKPITDKNRLAKVKKKFGLPNYFILYVGDINYNKNVSTLIKACEKSKTNLVICGKQAGEIESLGLGLDVLAGPQDWFRFLFNIPHPELAHYEEILPSLRSRRILRLGYVSDDDLVSIYNLAKGYVQPSLYEGFGLPVLEALACGIPVIASRINAHQEVAAGSVEYFDPHSVDDLAKKIGKLKGSSKSQKLPEDYSWNRAAKETIEVYRKVCP